MERDPRTMFPSFGPINEESCFTYTAELKDKNGCTVFVVNNMYLTLFDKGSGIIINKRKHQDILNSNGGVFESGKLTMNFTANDSKLVIQENEYEEHIAQFEYSFLNAYGQPVTCRHSIVLRIQNLAKIGG